MKFAKLMDEKGCQIDKPKMVMASVSFDGKTGDAHAWEGDGKTLLAELKCARVIWIGVAGIRIEGHEPIDAACSKFRLMQWQMIFN